MFTLLVTIVIIIVAFILGRYSAKISLQLITQKIAELQTMLLESKNNIVSTLSRKPTEAPELNLSVLSDDGWKSLTDRRPTSKPRNESYLNTDAPRPIKSKISIAKTVRVEPTLVMPTDNLDNIWGSIYATSSRDAPVETIDDLFASLHVEPTHTEVRTVGKIHAKPVMVEEKIHLIESVGLGRANEYSDMSAMKVRNAIWELYARYGYVGTHWVERYVPVPLLARAMELGINLPNS